MIAIVKRILKISGEYRKNVILGLIFSGLKAFFVSLMLLAVLLIMINLEQLNMTIIMQATAIIVVSIFGRFIFQYLCDRKLSASGYEIFKDKRIEIGEKLKKAPMGYFSEKNLGTIQAVLTTTISDLEAMAMLAMNFIVGGFFQALTMTIMLLIFCFPVGMVSLIAIILGIVVLKLITKKTEKYSPIMQDSQEILVTEAIEYIRGISVLRSFKKGTDGKNKVEKAFMRKCEVDIEVNEGSAYLMKLYEMIFKVASCALVFVATILYMNSQIPLSYALMFIVSAFLIFLELELVSDGAFLSRMLATQLNRLEYISDIPSLDDGGKEIDLDSYDIELKDVCFGYGEREILNNINLQIKSNSSLAIVGASGSGKTTILRLISRLYDFDDGEILIGKKNIKEVSTESLYENISIVFQDVKLFNTSILENVRIGRKDASDDEVIEALKLANCDFIEDLKDGVLTNIGENGEQLSSGQRQRLSIARAFLKDAPILILDEIASSLDVDNERKIQKSLNKLIKNKTVIIISHRMKSIENADRIVVLKEGSVEDIGSHKELLKSSESYKKLVEKTEAAEKFVY